MKFDSFDKRYFDRQGRLKNDILVISGTEASFEVMKERL
jgi:hypothetical protein